LENVLSNKKNPCYPFILSWYLIQSSYFLLYDFCFNFFLKL
jgi:hypothetical protein